MPPKKRGRKTQRDLFKADTKTQPEEVDPNKSYEIITIPTDGRCFSQAIMLHATISKRPARGVKNITEEKLNEAKQSIKNSDNVNRFIGDALIVPLTDFINANKNTLKVFRLIMLFKNARGFNDNNNDQDVAKNVTEEEYMNLFKIFTDLPP